MLEFLQYAILGFPAFLIAGTVHEFMHAYTAKLLGDYTATTEGRLSLNPLAHIDPLGLIAMIFARFGWMKPVPVNEYNFKNPVLGTAITSIAGPASNVVMALISTGLYRLLTSEWLIGILGISGGFIATILVFISLFLYVFTWVNISLFIFNLIPLPPLDGYRVVRAFLPKNIRYYWEKLENFSVYILLALFLPFSPLSGLFSTYLINTVTFLIDILVG